MNAPQKSKKRATPRSPDSGKFEAGSPLTDPELSHFAVQTVRAIRHLQPLLAAMASSDKEGSEVAMGMAVTGAILSLLERAVLEELSADSESLAELKKKRLEAKALGCMPLAEVQRVQAMARAWMALPGAASNALAGSSNCAIDTSVKGDTQC